MIHYQLECAKAHGFDGWFRDSAAFDAQAARGLVECPACGDTSVRRALMTPAVPKKGREPVAPTPAAAPATGIATAPAPAPSPPAETPVAVAGERLPDHVRAMLQRVRAEVEKNCDYVGGKFADEARRIHRGETDARGIYGETTPAEAEALADEGIEINRIPWVPRADG
jgi:hypothetical protein